MKNPTKFLVKNNIAQTDLKKKNVLVRTTMLSSNLNNIFFNEVIRDFKFTFIKQSLANLELFFRNIKFSSAYAFQGRVSYLPQVNSLSYRFFFAFANQWWILRELFFIYELLFFFKFANSCNSLLTNHAALGAYASILLYEKLTFFLLAPQVFKNFFNISECLLKIKLTTSNFFFTALDSLTYKTLLTGTGGMLHLPLIRYSNRVSESQKFSKKKFAQRQDIKYKKIMSHNSKKTNHPRSKKFSKKQVQSLSNKKKRPKWIEKTSFASLFYLCDKFFNALRDFGYLQLRFWLLGHKVYNIFFKRKIIPRWKKQYSKLLFLSPYIIFQANRCHNGMRPKKTRRV